MRREEKLNPNGIMSAIPPDNSYHLNTVINGLHGYITWELRSKKDYYSRALSMIAFYPRLAVARKESGGVQRHQLIDRLLARCANNPISAAYGRSKSTTRSSCATITNYFEHNDRSTLLEENSNRNHFFIQTNN